MNQLCVDLFTANSLTAVLINQFTNFMREKANSIELKHLKKNEKGEIDWLPLGSRHTRDYSRLVYYPIGITAKIFTDEIKRVRTDEKKLMIRIPQHLAKIPFGSYFWDFEKKDLMHSTTHMVFKSELTFDTRTDSQRKMAKHSDAISSLKSIVPITTNMPILVHRQAGKRKKYTP